MRFSDKFRFCPACGASDFVVHNIKSKRCLKCDFIFYTNPSAAVAAFILNDNNELLVCRRAKEPAKGTLDLPGGFIDFDESAEQGLAREIAEELGATLCQSTYLFSLPNLYEYSGLTVPTLDLFFKCSLDRTHNLKPDDDVTECFFVPLNELDPGLFGLSSIRIAVKRFVSLTTV